MINKLKCAVVDDDVNSIEALKDLLKDSSQAEITHSFTSPKRFLQEYPDLNIDVCIFDIVMPEMDGFSLTAHIQDKPVILITSVEGKLIEAIDMVAPVDVLRKPIRKERLDSALKKARQFISKKGIADILQENIQGKRKEYDFFNTLENGRKLMIKLSDIVMVTANMVDPRNKKVLMKDGEEYTFTNCTMERLLNAASHLIQINRSELVSIDSIREFERDSIVLNNINENGRNKQVTLGRRFREKFLDKISIL